MHLRSRGISSVLIAVLLVVVVAIAGVAYYALGSRSGGPSLVQSTTTSLSISSSTSLSSLRLLMQLHPGTPLVAPDVIANYTLDLTILDNLNRPLIFGYSGPAGVTATFSPPQVQPGSNSAQVTISFEVAGSTAVGAVPFNITAQSGRQKYSQGFQAEVVRYLVTTVGTTFLPANMTVTAGSTVYWVRLNGAIDQYDNGNHNVAFGTLGVTSPTLAQYDSWSYVFNQAGTYDYVCTFHASMNGVVVVSGS